MGEPDETHALITMQLAGQSGGMTPIFQTKPKKANELAEFRDEPLRSCYQIVVKLLTVGEFN